MKSVRCILCLALSLTGCVYKTGALRGQISHYEGDGAVRDASIGAPPFFWGPGFRIVFSAFDPRKPYEHSYQLKGVPKTKYGESTIYVRFPGDWSPDLDSVKQKVTAVLSFNILDGNGVVLKSQDIVFSRAIWSWSGGAGDFGLWVQNENGYGAKNDFYFDPPKRYTLQIVYVPGSVPPPTTNMYVTIENGGYL